jgi:hypothetical protein
VDTFLGYYSGKQRAVYEKAAASLSTDPVRKGDARVQTFVKAEKIDLTKKPDPVPRLIQPRNPRYNVEVGRFLKPIEKLVYRGIAKVWGGPTVLKLNAHSQASELRAMWESFDRPVAFGLDASRFDQHVSIDALRWEHDVYKSMFSGRDRNELGRLLSWQERNIGRVYVPTAKVKYQVVGARMSGDINTSLGNCLIMCAMMWAYVQEKGVRARLANNGDDCVLICEQSDYPKLREGLGVWFREMGFTMEVEDPVTLFEHIEFCQTRPVKVNEGWLMVRSFDRAISRDMSSLLDLRTGLQSYFGAVGEAGLAGYGQVPVYQELYAAMKTAGKVSKLRNHSIMAGGMAMLTAGMDRVFGAVSPETRASFCYAFGVTPDEQEGLETWLRSNPLERTLPQVLTPLVEVWYR